MKSITEYLSRIPVTANQRFNFKIPDTVQNDLTQCLCHCVNQSGHEFVINENTKEIIRCAVKWLKSGKCSLLLLGNIGTGKTKLLEAISLLINYYSNRNTSIISSTNIVRLSLSKEDSEINRFNNFKTFPYLFIDDLGIEPVNVNDFGTIYNPVIDILLNRYNTMKTTIISTNLNIDQIKQIYGDRIYDRFCEQYDRIIFEFNSFRQN
jgi:DNA replication protein DnaC